MGVTLTARGANNQITSGQLFFKIKPYTICKKTLEIRGAARRCKHLVLSPNLNGFILKQQYAFYYIIYIIPVISSRLINKMPKKLHIIWEKHDRRSCYSLFYFLSFILRYRQQKQQQLGEKQKIIVPKNPQKRRQKTTKEATELRENVFFSERRQN